MNIFLYTYRFSIKNAMVLVKVYRKFKGTDDFIIEGKSIHINANHKA